MLLTLLEAGSLTLEAGARGIETWGIEARGYARDEAGSKLGVFFANV